MKNYSSILAKSNPFTTLKEHSEDAMSKAILLCKESGCCEYTKSLCAISALFHDIGKCTSDFQDYIKNSTKKKYAHNVISAMIFDEFVELKSDKDDNKNEVKKKIITKAIMYHHPLPKEMGYFGHFLNEFLTDDDINTIKDFVQMFVDEYNSLKFNITLKTKFLVSNYYKNDPITDTSYYNQSHDFTEFSNPHLTIVNGIVRFADILASNNNVNNFDKYTKFTFDINSLTLKKPSSYDNERYKTQCETAEKLRDCSISVLYAPPGYGKTLIGIRWMLCDDKKLIWVCPTNELARCTYFNIMQELENLGLKDTVKVGLLLTNKWMHGEEYACQNDIIVTNIDNYARPIFISDEKKHMAFNFNYVKVLFDEYDKYIGDSGLLATFETALRSRSLSSNTKTLLMSATGNELFYRDFKDKTRFDGKLQEIYVDATNFCKKEFNLKYGTVDYSNIGADTLVVRNSVNRCQEAYDEIVNHNPNLSLSCVHSKYTSDDFLSKMNDVLKSHGKDGDKELSVASTNIFTTGVNISFRNIVIGISPLDEIIQTAGRCNRNNEYTDGNILIDDKVIETKNEKCAINAKYNYELCMYEYEYLKKHLNEGEGRIKLSDLYNLRTKLWNEKEYQNMRKEVFKKWMENSFEVLSNMDYTYSGGNPDDNESDTIYISKKPTIRNSNKNYSNTNNSKSDEDMFIRLKCMKDGQCIQLRVSSKIVEDSITHMIDTLERDPELCQKYLGKNYKRMIKNMKNDKIKCKQKFVKMAKCSDTPFIVDDKFYEYTYDTGLREK